MNKEQLKLKTIKTIDENRDRIISIANKFFSNPELGFKEHKTSELVKLIFNELNIEFEDNIAITGVKGTAKGKSDKIKVAILGELDAVVCPLHPHADDLTGAAHSCGHHAQITTMLGAAMGLVLSDVISQLDGDVTFIAVPAEEYVELEYRQKLKQEGKIEFFGGKQELIRLGTFDDIDMGMMVHSHAQVEDKKILTFCDSSGFVGKVIKYTGKEAHAGAVPHLGVNALNAAMLGIMGIHAQRETFKESDRIRIHPIMTKGGDMVNIVPADVHMETYVRGRNMEAVLDASHKVNRALKAGADAIGAEVEIKEIPGYLPLVQNKELNELISDNATKLIGEENVLKGYELMGATDAGDISSIIPFIHLSSGGYKGVAHSKDFEVCDEDAAYIIPAKSMAMSIIDLLYDDAELATKIIENHVPLYTKETYLDIWKEL